MKKYSLFIILLCFILTGCKEESFYQTSLDIHQDLEEVVIDIKGAVAFPGVYTLSSNALLKDAIELAGGLVSSADSTLINFVSPLVNHQLVIIPYKKEANLELSKLININQATATQLMSLPGIGQSKANAIIQYRMQYGYFIQIEDIMKVSGIGEEVFSQIKTLICIS